MQFSKPVMEIIKTRSSCRSYIDKPIEEETQKLFKAFLLSSSKGVPFNTNLRFELIASTQEDRDILKGLGTYGFIKGSPGFIVGASVESKNNLEDYGYAMEKIILYATDIGLSTCWLGGTFNKSSFSEKISVNDEEFVPAVAAIGYCQKKRSAFESIVRWTAGSDNRKPWNELFFNDNFSNAIDKDTTGDYSIAIEMVRLAPSASNKQPWRIVKDKGGKIFHFFLQRTKGYNKNQKLLKLADLQRIDMGIAMCHFELSAMDLNLKGNWRTDDIKISDLPENTEYIISWVGC